MEITYIKELENWQDILGKKVKKFPYVFQRFSYYVKKWLGIGKIRKLGKNRQLKILPYTIEELEQKWYKRKLRKETNIILSKTLFSRKEFNIITTKQKIWDGKWLFSYLIIETLEYISQKTDHLMEQMNVAILVTDTSEENIQTILNLAEKVKSLSVITKKIARFRQIEKTLYEEKGIAIKLSNNKKKSLNKESIIFNMDLKQEEINQYEINRKAIVVNIKETVDHLPKGFSRN